VTGWARFTRGTGVVYFFFGLYAAVIYLLPGGSDYGWWASIVLMVAGIAFYWIGQYMSHL
jgi:hypothetical protein